MQAFLHLDFYNFLLLETVCSICSVEIVSLLNFRKTFPLYIVQFSKNLYPFGLVEISRIELLTPCLQGRCSPS